MLGCSRLVLRRVTLFRIVSVLYRFVLMCFILLEVVQVEKVVQIVSSRFT